MIVLLCRTEQISYPRKTFILSLHKFDFLLNEFGTDIKKAKVHIKYEINKIKINNVSIIMRSFQILNKGNCVTQPISVVSSSLIMISIIHH